MGEQAGKSNTGANTDRAEALEVAPTSDAQPAAAYGKQNPGLLPNAILAGAGGFLDAFTYVGHGHVFANAMTGNVVMLGVYAMGRNWSQSFRHLPPILAFLLGVSTAKAIHHSRLAARIGDPALAVLTMEILLFMGLSWLPMATPDFWITTTVAFAASAQTATFRDVEGFPYNSTFTTGNLRTLSESLFAWIFEGRHPESSWKARVFFTICVVFLLGAALGALATAWLQNRALWVECLLLGTVWMIVVSKMRILKTRGDPVGASPAVATPVIDSPAVDKSPPSPQSLKGRIQ